MLKVFAITRRAHGDPFRVVNLLPFFSNNFNYSMRLVVISASLLLLSLHYFACALWLVLRVQVGGTWRTALHQDPRAGLNLSAVCNLKHRPGRSPAIFVLVHRDSMEAACSRRTCFDYSFDSNAALEQNADAGNPLPPPWRLQGFPPKTWPVELQLLDGPVHVYEAWTWWVGRAALLHV
jgi:hypothetical protein